jgi:hypothetical protein
MVSGVSEMRFVVTALALFFALPGCMAMNGSRTEAIEFRANESLFYPRLTQGIDHIDENERQPEPTQQQLRRLFSASSRSILDWDYLCDRPGPGPIPRCVIAQEQLFTEDERAAIHAFMRTRRVSPPVRRNGQSIDRFWGGYLITVVGTAMPALNECRSASMCGIPTPPPPPRN